MCAVKNLIMKKYLFLAIALLAFGACNKVKPIKEEIKYKVPTEAEAIDLGLPSGTLWAPYNIGAERPQDVGNYFAWGETTGYNEGKTIFNDKTYKWCQGTFTSLTKYNTDPKNGDVDNLTELELADDAAYVCWGSNWITPTNDQLKELVDPKNTTCSHTTMGKTAGMMIISNTNSNMLFIPFAGTYLDGDCYDLGEGGYYWSRDLSSYNTISAFSASGSEDGWCQDSWANRWSGLSVRAVINK